MSVPTLGWVPRIMRRRLSQKEGTSSIVSSRANSKAYGDYHEQGQGELRYPKQHTKVWALGHV